MLLTEFHRTVDEILPPAAAMHGDAIGLQVESKRGTATHVLIALELTDDVLQEAVQHQCDAILVFHPLIYAPLTEIRRDDRVGRLVAGLISADIALLAVHTAFDAFPQGTNHVLARRLGVSIENHLVPSDVPGFGMGIVGSLSHPMEMRHFVDLVATVCGSPVRYVAAPDPMIQRVAIVGGSGISFYDAAVASGADVFVTADVKYHAFHAAHGHLGIVDPGHYEMEQFVPDGIQDALASRLKASTTLRVSQISTNPVRYAGPLPIEHSTHL